MGQQGNGGTSTSYVGMYERGIDGSHRILMPFDWRLKGAPKKFYVVSWPVFAPEHLVVIPPDRWDRLVTNFDSPSIEGDASANLERLVSSKTSFCSMDRFGRLPLPEQAVKTVGISEKVLMIGRLTKFEIWNPEKLNKQLNDPALQELAEILNKFKI